LNELAEWIFTQSSKNIHSFFRSDARWLIASPLVTVSMIILVTRPWVGGAHPNNTSRRERNARKAELRNNWKKFHRRAVFVKGYFFKASIAVTVARYQSSTEFVNVR
jgi:hypothetical protein